MKITRLYKFLFTAACCFFGGLAHSQQGQPEEPTLKIGDAAPPLDVVWVKGNANNTIAEKKPYVVELWATWCVPCINGMPHLSEVARKYRGRVDIIGISINERGENIPSRIQRFVDSMGRNMDYTVARENNGSIAKNWLMASGQRGIPTAFAVDQQGRIAWTGAPKDVDTVLPKILDKTWDLKQFEKYAEEKKRLSYIDGNAIVTRFNKLMHVDRYAQGLPVIDSVLSKEPGLKYYPKMGHFTYFILLNTSPLKAVEYGKIWLASNEWPGYMSVLDAMRIGLRNNKAFPVEVYEFTIDSYEKQMKHYPPNASDPQYLSEMANLYFLVGKKAEAVSYMKKAVQLAAQSTSFSSRLANMKQQLEKYEKM